jgi:beta-lactamase class C
MKNASLDFESFSQNPDKAYPHQQTGNEVKPVFTPLKLNNRYYTTAPAAGVNASISDMGQFLLAISSKDDDLFSEEARKITYTPQIESILKRSYYRNWGALGTKYYALGWRIIHFKNHTIAQHSGFVQGYQSEIAVCHDSEIGIAVLTNSPNSFTSTYIPAFLSMFFDHQQKMKPNANLNDSVPETFREEEVSN